MFIDSAVITLNAGKGGNGVVAWRREKYIPKGGPSGGNGGKGGAIILRAEQQILSLQDFRNRRIIRAENGMAGGGALKQGRNGKDLVLTVPCGTLVKDARTKEVLLDLTEDGQEWVICKGGRGGKGNNCFKSPTNQAPNICTEGTAGESKEIELELKLIADIGLVGMPNAGKSTLLSTLSHVPLKIAAYPFTTLTPNLSFIQAEDYSRLLIADIPGIIEDAHNNRGLGIAFLKHVERSFVLVYVIDIAAYEGRDPIEDFRILRDEIKAYREDLMDKPFIVALNKTDVEGADEQIARFRTHYPFPPQQFFEISALTGQGLPLLVEGMRSLVKEPQALELVALTTNP